jgi:hypothetical protein
MFGDEDESLHASTGSASDDMGFIMDRAGMPDDELRIMEEVGVLQAAAGAC